MYAAESMERMEYRRNRRAAVRRQQRARQRMMVFFCLTIVIMFVIGVGFGTILTRAEEKEHVQMHRYYANIEIESGDTLWEIAEEYMDDTYYANRTDYMNEIMTVNGMVSDQLISGQKLIIPYYSVDLR